MNINRDEIEKIQNKHNRILLLKGVGFALLSALLWYLSYWLIIGIIAAICWPWGVYPSSTLFSGIAFAGLVLISFEGIRYKKKLFDAEEALDSIYMKSLTGTRQEALMIGRPLANAWVISQFFYSAPRTSIKALQAFKKQAFFSDQELTQAEAILTDLIKQNKWMPVKRYEKYVAVLMKMEKLALILHRLEGDTIEIKIHTSKLNSL